MKSGTNANSRISEKMWDFLVLCHPGVFSTTKHCLKETPP